MTSKKKNFIPNIPKDDDLWLKIINEDIYKQAIKLIPEDQREESERAIKEMVLPFAKNMINAVGTIANNKKK